MIEPESRAQIADDLEELLRPLVAVDKFDGGYNCCGCGTYDLIVDDAVRVALGDDPKGYLSVRPRSAPV